MIPIKKRHTLKLILVLGNILVLNTHIQSQNKMKYAEYLFRERDYFRAISVYKNILYYSDNSQIKNYCLLQIVRSYHKSNKYKSSIKYISRLLNQPTLSDEYFIKSQVYLGLNYYGLKVYPLAEEHLKKVQSSDTTGLSLFYLALVKSENEKWQEANQIYKKLYRQHPSSKMGTISEQLAKQVIKGHDIPQKSPFLATLMSSLIPGSGQFYSHHYYDGLQAFLFVSAFSFASYMAYRYDKNYNNNFITTYVSISITSIFHIANIIGAQRTASYYNLRHKDKFLSQIREKAFSIEY